VQACEVYVGAASLAELRNRNRERISKWVEEDFKIHISERICEVK